VWLLLAGIGVLVLLAGCIAQPKPVRSAAPLINTAPPTETVVAVPNGVMASGSFRSSDGTTSGQFEITNASGHYSLTFSHFRSDIRSGLVVSLADSAVSAKQCGSFGASEVVLDNLLSATSVNQAWPITSSNAALNDPSFLQTLIVASYGDGSSTSACARPIIAVATLEWRIPETHPDLVVRDGGVANYAWGTVTMRNGQPFTYLTHQGDNWSQIAKRFGISEADLTWLNPIRLVEYKPRVAYVGQVLNLSPANRGDSASRPLHPDWS
jgi:hypothetical protein